jgi:sugar lactone lactonase YvrE
MGDLGLLRGALYAGVGLLLLGVPTTANAAGPAKVPLRTVITFDPAHAEYPEGIAVDARGAIYVGIASTGEVRRVAPDGSQRAVATVPIGSSGGFILGLASPRPGVVYVADTTHEPASHGVWQVIDRGPDRPGEATRIAALPVDGQPNGIATDEHGNAYVGDSTLGVVWRISPHGAVSRWAGDPLLAPLSGPDDWGVGANGVFVRGGCVFVASSDQATIVRITVGRDGRAGPAVPYVSDPSLLGADDLTFDAAGNLYVSSSRLNTLTRVSRGGRITGLADASDGLDYTAGLEFGRTAADRHTLYIVDVGGNFNQPKLQAADLKPHGE